MRRLLIVEDDPAIGPMVKEILRHEGFESSIVTEGKDALTAFRTGSYDGVILDVMLPGLDGMSILRAIREHETRGHTPVVMLTAKVDDASTWEGWKAGCDSYLPKPFDPDQLVAVVKRLSFPNSAPASGPAGR
jgi:DNA-binding response OmpR family regulator